MTDLASLILEVDSTQVKAGTAELNKLTTAGKGAGAAATEMAAAAQTAAGHVGKMTLATNSARMAQQEMMHAVRGSVDQFAAGAAPTQIFAQHISMVAQAASLGGASMGKMGAILAGPWGLALTAAVSIGSLFIGKLLETNDAVGDAIDKLKKHAAEQVADSQAQRQWSQTMDGVEQSIRDVNKALDELANKSKTTAEKELDVASGALKVAEANEAVAQALLNRARAQLEVTQGQAAISGSMRESGAAAEQQVTQSRFDVAQKELDRANAGIASSRAAIELAQSFVTTERAASTEAEKINHKYNLLEESTRRQLLAQHQVGDELTRQINLLEKKRKLELDSLDTTKKQGEYGKQISFAGAESIARAAGLTVTSGQRSYADQQRLYDTVRTAANPVARPGTSAHEGVNGKWALDIAFAPGLTPEKLKKLYGDQGVSLSAIYKESGHFHIEGSRSEAAAGDRAAEQAARKAEAEAQRQITNAKAYNDNVASLNDQIIRAKRALATGAEEQAQFAVDDVNNERDKTISDAKSAVLQHRITQSEETHLEVLARSLALVKKIAIERERQLSALSQAQTSADQQFQFQEDSLKFADQMATTQGEHRRIQLQLLDILYDQKKYDLEILKAKQELAHDLQAAARTQHDIDNLPAEKGRAQAIVKQGTMSPWEQYKKESRDAAADINASLESIAVRGLGNLADGLTEVIMGTKSLGAAFKDIARSIIADIIQMTIKMLIFKAISAVFGAKDGAVFGGGFAMGGAFGGGNVIPFAGGGVVTQPTLFPMSGGRTGVMGEAGPEAVMPLARDGSGRLGVRAANSNTQGPIEVHIALTADAGIDARVESVSARMVGQAAPVIVKAAVNATTRSLNRPRLMGRSS
jgi:lambda family phage tail tape measure protein